MSIESPPRLSTFLRHKHGIVLLMDRIAWDGMKPSTGAPVEVELHNTPLASVTDEASFLAAVATRTTNNAVAIEIFRDDKNDAPTPVNKDVYTVWEDLSVHPELKRIIVAASTRSDDKVKEFLARSTFFVKREPSPDHWQSTLPSTVVAAISRP